jgi:SOS-response transcriptional repressor LexA
MRSLRVNQKVTCEVTLLSFDYTGFWTRLLSAFGTENAAEIGRQIGLERQSLYKWRDGINQPSLDSLIAISEKTSRSLHWLLTGHGQEYINQLPSPAMPFDNNERKTIEGLAHTKGQTVDQTIRELLIEALKNRGLMSRQSPTMLIFRHDMKLVALLLIGSISADQPITYFEKQKQKQVMVAEAFIPPDHAGYQFCLLQIVGNDVAEGLRDGDYLICCDNRNPTSDSVVVALINGGTPVVKRIFHEGHNVRLHPYNNKSPGETYPAGQVEILYTVTGIQHNP